MSSPDPQAQIAQLRADHNRLTTAVTLQHKQDALQDLERAFASLAQNAQKLSQEGYPRGAALSGLVQTLTHQLEQVRGQFSQLISAASTRLQAELNQSNLTIGGALGGQTALVASSVSALEALNTRVELADEQLDALLEPLNTARYPLETLFRALSWSLEAWNDFSGDRNSSGGLLIAAEAEWKQTGRGGDDPDGVLYLTDKALIFEQKEKKGKTLGMFGGKMVQEVEWAIPLGDIGDVRAKNEGMFGGRDILFITVNSGDPAPEVKVEVKGNADNKIWATYIQKASQNAEIFDAPDVASSSADLSAWSGPLPAAPSATVNMAGLGAALAGMGAARVASEKAEAEAEAAVDAAADVARAMFGIKEAAPSDSDDDKPSGIGGMKGLAQKMSNDDDDDAPKGGQKSFGGAKGEDDTSSALGGMMKNLAQNMSKDDDDNAPKGGQKPSGGAKGGQKED